MKKILIIQALLTFCLSASFAANSDNKFTDAELQDALTVDTKKIQAQFGKSRKSDLIGVWVRGNEFIEFTKDNKFIYIGADRDRKYVLDYEATKENEFLLTGLLITSRSRGSIIQTQSTYNKSKVVYFVKNNNLSYFSTPSALIVASYSRADPKKTKVWKKAKAHVEKLQYEYENRALLTSKEAATRWGCKLSNEAPLVLYVRVGKRHIYKCGKSEVVIECRSVSSKCIDVTPEPGAFRATGERQLMIAESKKIEAKIKQQKDERIRQTTLAVFTGTFNVEGESPQGDKYTGEATIKKISNSAYEIDYKLSTAFTAKATLYSNHSLIIRSPGEPLFTLKHIKDGVLHGTYKNSKGWEKFQLRP